MIPRAVKLLDYTYGGPDFAGTPISQVPSDIGGTAEIHAESGDTQIYGGPNLDYLFGGSGNDLITGGYGGKWISGGNGETGEASGQQTINTTGILGADGRLELSRNGIPEPLYGIAAVPAGETLNQVISTPGGILQATINVAGALTVTADIDALQRRSERHFGHERLDAERTQWDDVSAAALRRHHLWRPRQRLHPWRTGQRCDLGRRGPADLLERSGQEPVHLFDR